MPTTADETMAFPVPPVPSEPRRRVNSAEEAPDAHDYGSRRFLDLCDELKELHKRKNADYGTSDDPFANVRSSRNWGVPPWVGAMVRGNDKVVRLQAAAQGSSLVNEGVADSLMDLAAYALIALVLFEEQEAEK